MSKDKNKTELFAFFISKALFSLLALTLVLFTTSFSGFASAKAIIDQESKEVEELAKHLEFIFEEAALKGDNGNVIGFDLIKLKKNLVQFRK